MKEETIVKLLKASGAAEGELILIHFWGEDADKAVANQFMQAAAALGAAPVLLQQSRTNNQALFSVAKEGSFSERYFALFAQFDAVLDVFCYQPVVLGGEIEPQQFELYRNYMAQLFAALMKCRRFTQIRIPTAANAAESGLAPADYIDRMEAAYDVDYEALAASCEAMRGALQALTTLVLVTGEDCALHFELAGRSWHVDAGDGDLPCGEVYIAPVEDRTWGSVFFKTLRIVDAGAFENVTLRVSGGCVTGSDDARLNEFLDSLPPSGRVVCELGFGMNPNVKDLCGDTVLDEKMAGTFHIAIGANTMFGGENAADCHIDLVGGSYRVV